MADEQQPGFTFVDKRTIPQDTAELDSPNSTTSGPETTTATADPMQGTDDNRASEQAADSGGSQDPDASNHPGAMPRLNVRDRLLMCIDILNQGAWISLGLISDPTTGNLEKDLIQAKNAIDSVAFLANKVELELDEETRRELRNLVRDLHLNFVEQSSR